MKQIYKSGSGIVYYNKKYKRLRALNNLLAIQYIGMLLFVSIGKLSNYYLFMGLVLANGCDVSRLWLVDHGWSLAAIPFIRINSYKNLLSHDMIVNFSLFTAP